MQRISPTMTSGALGFSSKFSADADAVAVSVATMGYSVVRQVALYPPRCVIPQSEWLARESGGVVGKPTERDRKADDAESPEQKNIPRRQAHNPWRAYEPSRIEKSVIRRPELSC
jgi:hypothetical protein